MTRVPNSMQLYRRAESRIAGKTHLYGRRAELYALGLSPIYSDRQQDGHFWDVDGYDYVDFDLGCGAVLLGHAYPSVVRAVQEQAALGTGLTVNHPLELEVADLVAELVPCAEMVRFCKGGGEANAVAVRIARAATGRDKVLFCGYHGWHDWYLAANLNSPATLDHFLVPDIEPLGVPKALAGTAIPFEYNNLNSFCQALEEHRGEVACVILEAARIQTPGPGFLEGVRNLTRQHGVVLIFDEVVTGFRVSRGGAQELFGVTPDIATFAKCISNGFALGAVAGRREIMEVAIDSFISSVYWAEATGLAAGRATLREYCRQDVCGTVRQVGQEFVAAAGKTIDAVAAPVRIAGFSAFPSLVFDIAPELQDPILTLFLQEMCRRGIYGGPGYFFCLKHSDEDLRRSVETLGEALAVVRRALDEGDPSKYLQCPVRQSRFRRMV